MVHMFYLSVIMIIQIQMTSGIILSMLHNIIHFIKIRSKKPVFVILKVNRLIDF